MMTGGVYAYAMLYLLVMILMPSCLKYFTDNNIIFNQTSNKNLKQKVESGAGTDLLQNKFWLSHVIKILFLVC